MDFSLSEKMQTILGMIVEFVDRELVPLEQEFLRAPFGSLLPELEKKRAKGLHGNYGYRGRSLECYMVAGNRSFWH